MYRYVKYGDDGMSILKEMMREKIHSRNITMDTWMADEDHIIVEGRLFEERCRDYILLSGEKKEGGVLHHMVVRMKLKIPGLLICDIETELLAVPRDGCHKIHDSLNALKGERLEKGFTRRVHELLGGVRGCTHLNHLVITMAPAAMQGFFALNASRGHVSDKDRAGEESRLRRMERMLADSCYAWSEDSEALKGLRERIKKLQ